MDPDLVWFDLGDDYGVLELDERLTPPGLALELHVLKLHDSAETFAWWRTDAPGRAWPVRVGQA